MAEEVGLRPPLTVLAPATHDTASAVAAVPAVGERRRRGAPTGATSARGRGRCWASRSPGPIITAETLRDNFTNEGGVAGTTRLLKNIMGLWLVQECRRTWARPAATGRTTS